MSRENVEIVRSVYEAAARGDSQAVLALYDPDVVVDPSQSPLPQMIGGGTFHGHDGLRRFFRDRREAWEHIEDDCEELIDAGEQVISIVTVRGRGRASGIEVETRMAGLWTVANGRVTRVAWLPNREEALEAVGLRE